MTVKNKIFIVLGVLFVIYFAFVQYNFNMKVVHFLKVQDEFDSKIILYMQDQKIIDEFFLKSFNQKDIELKEITTTIAILTSIPDTNRMLKGSVRVNGLEGMGSGTIIKKTSNAMYVLTCHHVISDIIEKQKEDSNVRSTIEYETLNGNTIRPVEILKYDEKIDLALLKVFENDIELEEITISDNEPKKGDLVFSVGNPLGLIRTLSKGVISNIVDDFYVSDNTTTFGNSGGGLYNEDGELIGVPSQVMGYSVGIGFVPEAGLGMSRCLKTIKHFLKGTEGE